jgi:hypothetical protein
MFIGCTHMFCLLRCHFLLHIIVYKTSILKFPVALEFFNCSLFRVLKTHWNSCRLDWTRLGRCAPPVTLESDNWIGLDSTLLVCTHPYSVHFLLGLYSEGELRDLGVNRSVWVDIVSSSCRERRRTYVEF